MRVNQIVIKKDGPLHNINLKLSPVTLIIGDNERGKTRLISWIAKGLFKKNNLSKSETWSDTIDGSSNIQMDINPMHRYYDGERMQNLLFIKETDLLFKYKNQEELLKHEFWNNEINNILYGQDNISDKIQQRFLSTMGVGNKTSDSWLIRLHEGLFNLKNILEEFVPDIENLGGKKDGLYHLNDSISEVKKIEQTFESQEDLYFNIEKVEKAKKYFELIKREEQLTNDEKEYESLLQRQNKIKELLTDKDDTILDLENNNQDRQIEISQLEHKENQVLNDPYGSENISLSESLLDVFVGLAMSVLGIVFAYQARSYSEWTFNKIIALAGFVIGVFYLLKACVYSAYVQQLVSSSGNNPNFAHKFIIDKVRRDKEDRNKKLSEDRQYIVKLKDEVSDLRKEAKSLAIKTDVLKNEIKQKNTLSLDIDKLEQEVFALYNTEDLYLIYERMNDLSYIINQQHPFFEYDKLKNIRHQKNELLDRRDNISGDYEKQKAQILQTIKSSIEELKNDKHKNMMEYFYPELYHLYLNKDLLNYFELIEQVDVMIDQISKDRYKAEKIVNIYNNMESNSEHLLSKTLSSEFFEYLVQNIFGGRYRTFVVKNVDTKGMKIFAETGHGELYPLETLSVSAYAQFWFVLRLSLAKTILGSDAGIILLDDPFSTFDMIRKQSFIDVLNALVHEGWQIVLTITNDQIIMDNFSSLFGSKLTIFDLNKDY